jgi:hypothetical protein
VLLAFGRIREVNYHPPSGMLSGGAMKAVARDTLVKLELYSGVLQAMCVSISGWSLISSLLTHSCPLHR